MPVRIEVIRAEDNIYNAFLEDDYQIGNQIEASIEFDGKNFFGRGNNQDAAIEELRDAINRHYNAKKHAANTEINKALGQLFHD